MSRLFRLYLKKLTSQIIALMAHYVSVIYCQVGREGRMRGVSYLGPRDVWGPRRRSNI